MSMNDESPVLLELQLGVATITLNRPQVRNALDQATIQAFIQILNDIEKQNDIKAVIVRGKGEHFCSGADIQTMSQSAQLTQEENHQDAFQFAHLFQRLFSLNKPIIGLIQGSIFGGGVGLVACCDLVIADPNTLFCFPEVKLGLIPATISPYVVAAIGAHATKRYMMTAELFTAEKALQLGLVHEIATPDNLNALLAKILHNIQQNNSKAMKIAKNWIQQLASHPRTAEAQMIQAANLMAELRVSKEAQEGFNAFLEKRPPKWT